MLMMFLLKMDTVSVRFSKVILSDKLPPNPVAHIQEHLFLAHGPIGESGVADPRWTLLGPFALGFR